MKKKAALSSRALPLSSYRQESVTMSRVPDHVDDAFEFTNNSDMDNLITGNLTATVERVLLCALRK